MIEDEVNLHKASRCIDRQASARILLATLIFLGALFCPFSGGTQESGRTPGGLIATLSEFRLSTSPPVGNTNTCINVWEDGRFHLEHRSQQLPSSTAILQVYDSTLPEAQLGELRKIINSQAVRELPALIPADSAADKIWVRGLQVEIPREATVQKVGYFEWGMWEPGSVSQPAHEVVHAPQPEVESVLKALQEWMHRVSSLRLTQSSREGNFCGGSPAN